MDLWQQVLIETKNKSKMHLGLSDNVSNNIVNRFMIISDDCQRISKKVKPYTVYVSHPKNKPQCQALFTLQYNRIRRTLCCCVCSMNILYKGCSRTTSVNRVISD